MGNNMLCMGEVRSEAAKQVVGRGFTVTEVATRHFQAHAYEWVHKAHKVRSLRSNSSANDASVDTRHGNDAHRLHP